MSAINNEGNNKIRKTRTNRLLWKPDVVILLRCKLISFVHCLHGEVEPTNGPTPVMDMSDNSRSVAS